MKKCFIICPIGDNETVTRKRSDTLLNYVLKPLCSECGFEAIRVDELNIGNSITKKIIELLDCSDLVIADLTELNPNVFYELGYRTALGKPTIQIKSKGEPLPFDINSIQTFDYNINDLADTDNFKLRIKQTIQSYNYDSLNTNPEEQQINFNSVILQEIYKIQDTVNSIKQKLSINDTAAISILVDKLAQTNVKLPETAVAESAMSALSNIISEAFKNPNALAELAKVTKKINSDQKITE